MIDSANTEGLRARKRAATRSAITARARELTAGHGLTGFTLEQLCEDVGISRRTFFNYFPTKEDAIVGHLLDEFPADATAAFLAGGAGTERGPSGVSTTLLADLYRLTCAMVAEFHLTREGMRQLIAAMKKEPSLLMKVVGSARDRERDFAALIAEREELPAHDPVAAMAAALFGTCSQRASEVFFSEENTTPYEQLLRENLLAARQLFTQSTMTLSPLTFEGPQ